MLSVYQSESSKSLSDFSLQAILTVMESLYRDQRIYNGHCEGVSVKNILLNFGQVLNIK